MNAKNTTAEPVSSPMGPYRPSAVPSTKNGDQFAADTYGAVAMRNTASTISFVSTSTFVTRADSRTPRTQTAVRTRQIAAAGRFSTDPVARQAPVPASRA